MNPLASSALRTLSALFAVVSVVLACSFSATGCGGDDDPASRAPLTPASGPATTDVAPAGVLRIRIAGLPQGTDARVVVTGPNELEKKVPVDADLALPPGTYVVRAAAVGDGTVPNADGYRPKSVAQTVTLDATAGVVARVDYEKVATRISADAKVVDPATAAAMISVVRNDDGSAMLTLGAATDQSKSWKPGDILVLGQTPSTPEGFFGRIVSTDGKTILTKRATMQEVVEEGVFVFSRSFGSEDVKSVTALDSGVSAATICNSLSVSLPASRGAASLALTTTGDLCFTADMNLSLSFSGKVLPDVYFRADAGITSGLTVEGAATIGIGIRDPHLLHRARQLHDLDGPHPVGHHSRAHDCRRRRRTGHRRRPRRLHGRRVRVRRLHLRQSQRRVLAVQRQDDLVRRAFGRSPSRRRR